MKQTKVKPGCLFIVKNKNKHPMANAQYIHTWLESPEGTKPYLFTESQLDQARVRAEGQGEDILKLSKWWQFWK